MKPDGRALLDAIYAAPHDLAPRLVYADFLQDRGDPRGELITLQLQPNRTEAQLARETELVEAHSEAWIGRLAEITTWVEFELGFLARCGLRTIPKWALRRREWATVKHVGIADHWNRDIAALVVAPPLVSLESLRVPAEALASLGGAMGPARVRQLTIDGRVTAAMWTALAATRVLAQLKVVEIVGSLEVPLAQARSSYERVDIR